MPARIAKKRATRALARSERVFLRPPLSADGPEFLDLRRKSRELHERWEPRAPANEDPYGPKAFARYLAASRGARKRRYLVCRRGDGAILGSLSLAEITGGILRSAIVAYWIGAPFARRKYMSEALALFVRYAFTELGLHRLEALILPENEASRRLLARSGFAFEGVARRIIRLDGRWRDHERWAITAEDLSAPDQRPQSRK